MTNTRPSESDAIQMARYRRLPLPDTHTGVCGDDARGDSIPRCPGSSRSHEEQLAQMTTTLASLRRCCRPSGG